MSQKTRTTQASPILETFFQAIEAQTQNSTHLRVLKAARKPNPTVSVENELAKVMEEILHEA